MRKRNVALLTVGATLLFGTLALAGGWGRGAGPAYQALGLNQEQADKIQAVTAKCQERMAGIRDELFAHKQQLRALWNAPDLDAKAVGEKQAQLRDLQEEMQALRLQCETERRAVLTAEQKAKLGESRNGRGPGFGGGCGGPGGRGAGAGCGGAGWCGGGRF